MIELLQLSQRDLLALRAHAEQAYPGECCGVLLGRSDGSVRVATTVMRCANAADTPAVRYRIDAGELIRLQRGARAQGLQIVAFYHSHPDHPPRPSPTDVAEAYWTSCSYVIIAVEHGRATTTKSFVLTGAEEHKRFEDEPLIVEALP